MNYCTRVVTRSVWNWADIKPVLVAEHSRLYFGPVAKLKGASAQQNDLAASQTQFYNTLQQQQQQQFGQQSALYNSIRSVYDPIVAAGPNQYGFGAAEDTALRTQASEGTAAQYQQANSATQSALAARGGGNSFLPSGVNADISAKVSGAAAQQESSQQLGITNEGYQVGRQNFQNATNTEMGIAAGYNPLGFAGAATQAGTSAFNSATEIQKANAAASPWGTIGGLVGGVAGAFAGNPGLGASIGGFLGNAGSGNSSTPNYPTPDYSTMSFGS